MKVVLFRHGIAVDRADPACPPDAQRPLTPKGIRRTAAAARGLRAMEVRPDRILTSPLVRARETARIAADVLDCADLRETDALRGGVRTREAFRALAEAGVQSVMCVGHAPQLDVLLAQSIGGSGRGLSKLKKAGAACIDFDEVAPGRGQLVWLLQPRELRELGAS